MASKVSPNSLLVKTFLASLIHLQQQAHTLGLHITAGALNNAQNAAGWDLADNPDAAALAAKGERPK